VPCREEGFSPSPLQEKPDRPVARPDSCALAEMRSASRVVGLQNWCQAKSSKGLLAVGFADQRFIAEINQHRMVLEIKPTAEDIETAVSRPSRRIGEPTCQLFDEISSRALTHDRPELGSVLLQSQVRPRPVIVCQTIPQHLTKVSLMVGTVKKSIATISPTWFFRKVFQVCDGGRSTVLKTRDTVRSETSIPSFSNSP
jgi:hypothetical protein